MNEIKLRITIDNKEAVALIKIFWNFVFWRFNQFRGGDGYNDIRYKKQKSVKEVRAVIEPKQQRKEYERN